MFGVKREREREGIYIERVVAMHAKERNWVVQSLYLGLPILYTTFYKISLFKQPSTHIFQCNSYSKSCQHQIYLLKVIFLQIQAFLIKTAFINLLHLFFTLYWISEVLDLHVHKFSFFFYHFS